MDNNKVTSTAIASLYNTDVNYDFYGNEVSFKHIEMLPAGELSEAIQVTLNGTVSKVAWDEPLATIKPIHQTTVPRGYKKIPVKFVDGKWLEVGVHRLVHFADNGEWSDWKQQTVIHHINSITDDNRAENLTLTTSSANVLRFFRGADNQEEIKNQQYLNDRINAGTVPLMFEGKLIEGYTINTMGEVFHKRIIKGEVVNYKQHPSIANPKYPTNLNVKFNGKTTGLAHLMAENFLEVPTGYYKTLMKDASIANPYQPQNLYTVAKKHQ